METGAALPQEISFINTKSGFIHDQEFKVVYIGERYCGKTQFKNRFCKNKFSCQSQSTIGVEFSSKSALLPNNKICKIQIWDTAGQEKTQAISSVFYRNADGIVLFFDISRKETFEKMKSYWLKQVEQYAPVGVPIVLVGNKRDLEIIRRVNCFESYRYALDSGMRFMEGSALSGENVENVHKVLVGEMYLRNLEKLKSTGFEAEIRRKKQVVRLCSVVIDEESSCC